MILTCGFTLQALKTPYSLLTRHERPTQNSNPQNNGGGTVVLPIAAATANGMSKTHVLHNVPSRVFDDNGEIVKISTFIPLR